MLDLVDETHHLFLPPFLVHSFELGECQQQVVDVNQPLSSCLFPMSEYRPKLSPCIRQFFSSFPVSNVEENIRKENPLRLDALSSEGQLIIQTNRAVQG